MTWNHRVFRTRMKDGSYWFDIRETYYDKKNIPDSFTDEPIAPGGDSLSDLAVEIERMAEACRRPVLEFDEDTQKIVQAKP